MHKICGPSAHCWGKKTHFSQQAFYIQNCSFHTARRETIDSQQSGMQLTHGPRAALWSSLVKAIRARILCILRNCFFLSHMYRQGKNYSQQELPVLSALQTANELRWVLDGRRQGGVRATDHGGCYLYFNTCFYQAPDKLEHSFFWCHSSIVWSPAYASLWQGFP